MDQVDQDYYAEMMKSSSSSESQSTVSIKDDGTTKEDIEVNVPSKSPKFWNSLRVDMSRNMRKPTLWILTRSDTNQAV